MKYLILFMFLFYSLVKESNAQDRIILAKSSEAILCSIMEVNDSLIEYRLSYGKDRSLHTIDIEHVSGFLFENFNRDKHRIKTTEHIKEEEEIETEFITEKQDSQFVTVESVELAIYDRTIYISGKMEITKGGVWYKMRFTGKEFRKLFSKSEQASVELEGYRNKTIAAQVIGGISTAFYIVTMTNPYIFLVVGTPVALLTAAILVPLNKKRIKHLNKAIWIYNSEVVMNNI